MASTLLEAPYQEEFAPDLDEETSEEIDPMGSFNHGYVQMQLGALLAQAGDYTPVSELTLDISEIEAQGIDIRQFGLRSKEEIKPDISVYPKRGLSRPQDILKMNEMPLLAIEIVSPRQGLYELIGKFRVYFLLGVQSCWLIEPAINTVTVYAAIDQWETFAQGEVVDQKLRIRLTIDKIFA
ncbi:MAG: Uma2 family endonuclease [Caldilineaceae bacterium]